MGLFAKNKRNQPYAFLFICRGPGSFQKIAVIGRDDNKLKKVVTSSFYRDIPEKNIVVFNEDWNSTKYSSMELTVEGEYEDMTAKVQKKLKDEGYRFDFDKAKLFKVGFNKGTSYDLMGFWLLIVVFP